MIRHPGLKEELYLGDFEPDPAILERVGLSERPHLLAVARTAAAGAAYHRGDNPLFLDALRALGARDDVGIVVLARLPPSARRSAPCACRTSSCPRWPSIPARCWRAPISSSGRAAMTREAALLGVPTLSMFAGRPAAVDGWLEGEGMLARLSSADQIAAAVPAPANARDLERIRAHGRTIEDAFVGAIKDACSGGS